MSEALKPCPFCGGEAHQWHHPGLRGIFNHSIQCDACHVALTECSDDSYDVAMAAAVERWNARVERTCGEWRGWSNPNPSGFHDDDAELWCEHCDIELDDDWAYCPSCGAKVVDE